LMAPDAPRPYMELAYLQANQNSATEAWSTLRRAAEMAPQALALLAPKLAEFAVTADTRVETLGLLKSSYASVPSLDVLDAIVALEAAENLPASSARDWYVRHLERERSLVAAAKWIAGEKLEHEQFHPQVQRALDHAVKPLTRYRCAACGFEARQHFWQCPGCQTWDSYPFKRVEEL